MISSERQYFEKKYGRVPDSTWSDVKRRMNNLGLLLTNENIDKYMRLKEVFCYSIRAKHYLDSVQFFADKKKLIVDCMTGADFLIFLDAELEIKPSRSTITRWFEPYSGFGRKKVYTPSDLHELLLISILYKAKFDPEYIIENKAKKETITHKVKVLADVRL